LNQLISSSLRKRLSALAVLAALILTGCEAPLVLDGVEQAKRNAVRRSDNLQSMAYNGSTLIVVGSRGTVAASSDAGLSWTRTELPGAPFLMAVDTCPDKSFVAIDYQHNLWMANAEGADWHAKPIDTTEAPQTVNCDAQGRIWVVGGFSSILRSDDHGDSWAQNSLGDDLHFTFVQFIDADNGLVAGEFGVVARTNDGGENWEVLEPIPEEFYPQDAWFQSIDRGWVVGLNGTVYYTEDGGNNWQDQDTGTSEPIYSIVAIDDSLYAVGGNGLVLTCNGCISDKSGASGWKRFNHGLPIRFYLRGIAATGDKLWIAGDAGALHSITLVDLKNNNSGHGLAFQEAE